MSEPKIPPRRRRSVEPPSYVALSQEPVPCRGDPLGEIWWRGQQWVVTADGLECLDGTYFIEKSRMLEKPEYSWPEHMAGKIWVEIEEFTTAWVIALVLHDHAAKTSGAAVRKVFGKLPPPRLPAPRFGQLRLK